MPTEFTDNSQRAGVGKSILIVEDNPLNLKLFRDLLEAHGFTVFHTHDGAEAFRLIRLQRPDLVLMDIQLPEVSGLEVTRWLKDDPELRSIPVIAVTAFAMAGDEEKFLQSGCIDYIAKPISIASFIQKVNTALGGAAALERV